MSAELGQVNALLLAAKGLRLAAEAPGLALEALSGAAIISDGRGGIFADVPETLVD